MDEDIDFGSGITTRKPWLVVFLSIFFGSFAFVHNGRIGRAFAWFVIKWFFACIAMMVMLYIPQGRVAVYGGCAILLAIRLGLLVDALRVGREQVGKLWRPYQKWWAYLFLICAFIFADLTIILGVNSVWQEAFFLPTSGMRETLLPGDRFLVDKILLRFVPLRQGQVAIFYSPNGNGVLSARRVIAVAGDSVQFVEGKVLLNGKPLNEPNAYFLGENPGRLEVDNYGPVIVPEGHFFALGDNRWASMDSRYYGFVPEGNLIGIARVIFWSREYQFLHPTRANPTGGGKWGELRLNRIGMLVQ